ncbi:MAG: DUF4430 domain-containing protein, partial [Methanosarcinales archaeon]|nr:DUF4430 domain-containing protein [Methanosarcinales archaeon]
PFVINGYVSDSNSNPCNGTWVQITNLNTSVSWDAENSSTSNYYKLILDSDDVSAGNVLRFEASGCTETKTVEHTVTQSELEDGGMIDFDIVFDAGTMPDLTVTAIGTPVRSRADVINPISATVENIGSENATSFAVTLEAGGSIVDTATVTSLDAGENTTVEFLWTPAITGNQTLTVIADADGDVVESDETNNETAVTVNVLEKLTVTANVRIEGKNDTVWTGEVTFSNSTVTTTDGVTHYLNEPTALGALDEANKSGGFGYVLVDYGWGLYVSEIAGEPPIGWDGWMYRVNYASPWVGAADYTLYGGEDVLWYFGAWTAPPLKIALDRTTVDVGEVFVATVTAYNDSTALFDTVDAAEVYADGVLYGLTGSDGTLTMSLATAGDYQIHADKGTWADYTRSEKETVTVIEVTIPASVRIKPETLNLNSKGKFTAFITLPEGYDVADINVSTVECEGAPALSGTISASDSGTLVVKFDRANLAGVPAGDAVPLTVTGELTDGTRFEGSDMVEVIAKGA